MDEINDKCRHLWYACRVILKWLRFTIASHMFTIVSLFEFCSNFMKILTQYFWHEFWTNLRLKIYLALHHCPPKSAWVWQTSLTPRVFARISLYYIVRRKQKTLPSVHVSIYWRFSDTGMSEKRQLFNGWKCHCQFLDIGMSKKRQL